MIDPFTMAEEAVWTALYSHPLLCDLVKRGNMVNLTNDGAEELESRLSADLPHLALIPAGCSFPARGSDTQVVEQRYQVQAETGEIRTNKGLNMLKWRIMQALERQIKPLDTGVSPQILDIRPTGFDELTSGGEDGQAGWRCVGAVAVRFRVALKDVTT